MSQTAIPASDYQIYTFLKKKTAVGAAVLKGEKTYSGFLKFRTPIICSLIRKKQVF